MERKVEWAAVVEQLERCRRAGVINRYFVRNDHVILIQRRYAHRIPIGDVSTFLSGMIHYARAAGVDQLRQEQRGRAA